MKKAMEHIDETILLKCIENRADDNEKRLFERWVKSSEMHAEAFEKLKMTYQLTSIDTLNKQENWEAIASKMQEGREVPVYIELPRKPILSVSSQMRTLARVAAMLIIVLGVSFMVKTIVFNSGQLTISGKNLSPNVPYQLADGSKVYLNENSEITFPKNFGKNDRKILLKGEAFFEVHRNKDIPFSISTYNTTIQVLGTSFNVYSDSSEKVKLSVVSGVVVFYSGKEETGVRLKAGEQAEYSPGMAQVKKVHEVDPNFLAWKTGILYFKETPITEAFRLLQKQYSRVFVFESKQLAIPTLTTTIDNQTLEAVQEELNLLLNAKNVTRNDTIFFKPNS